MSDKDGGEALTEHDSEDVEAAMSGNPMNVLDEPGQEVHVEEDDTGDLHKKQDVKGSVEEAAPSGNAIIAPDGSGHELHVEQDDTGDAHKEHNVKASAEEADHEESREYEVEAILDIREEFPAGRMEARVGWTDEPVDKTWYPLIASNFENCLEALIDYYESHPGTEMPDWLVDSLTMYYDQRKIPLPEWFSDIANWKEWVLWGTNLCKSTCESCYQASKRDHACAISMLI